jgi:hypothetical protein
MRADGGVLTYLRETSGERLLVALNLTATPRTTPLTGRVLLSTALDREGEQANGELRLRAHEGLIVDAGVRG